MAASADSPSFPSRFPNWRFATWGGKQWWTDFHWQQGWRIQQNLLTGHWRLIDPRNVRYAWGSRLACQQALARLLSTHPPPNAGQPASAPTSTRTVILLHGLLRTAASMRKLQTYLTASLPYNVICFQYASTRGAIAAHAAALREVIGGLPDEPPLSFVGHSMGNIVVRHALADWRDAGQSAVLNRIDSIVMLGPPNRGSSIARQLARTGVFGLLTGRGGMELGPGWQQFERHLAIPHCPFGIIAGRLPSGILHNPLVDGAGDFIVSVEETRLEGAADFLEVPRMHSVLMNDPQVHRAVSNFLQYHSFQAPAS